MAIAGRLYYAYSNAIFIVQELSLHWINKVCQFCLNTLHTNYIKCTIFRTSWKFHWHPAENRLLIVRYQFANIYSSQITMHVWTAVKTPEVTSTPFPGSWSSLLSGERGSRPWERGWSNMCGLEHLRLRRHIIHKHTPMYLLLLSN
jgi:hypothetical protein